MLVDRWYEMKRRRGSLCSVVGVEGSSSSSRSLGIGDRRWLFLKRRGSITEHAQRECCWKGWGGGIYTFPMGCCVQVIAIEDFPWSRVNVIREWKAEDTALKRMEIPGLDVQEHKGTPRLALALQ